MGPRQIQKIGRRLEEVFAEADRMSRGRLISVRITRGDDGGLYTDVRERAPKKATDVTFLNHEAARAGRRR